ncbi:protein FAR1-RELATED SEQUENCE 5-like [Oryza brachyantha]|uniref:protein FAR1-RELATED SEQUENCE 5-like n=1 Tax=Oryza brachyantha TaxID=4533 RepID=UPI0007762809|nr:protein FAR1-RELATED SEQUENCE 5-like [Oryza brachyantha]
MFWSHASSQVEYLDFGDAVMFDTTYKTNMYEMPLVMFVGANHNMQSTLFGCALLRDEKIGSFEWLFETYKRCMGNCPEPRCFLTDQDLVMAVAVGRCFPNTKHRLCRWHVLNRHSDPLNIVFARNDRIESEMMPCINQTYTPYEFETSWDNSIRTHQLENCATMVALYEIREKWVPAFFKDVYRGRMTSTQHSESMNKLVKHKFVDHQTSLHRFTSRMLDVIVDRKEEEAAETRAGSGSPSLTTRWLFVVQMSRLYTRSTFRLFPEALLDSTDFRIDPDSGTPNGWIVSHTKCSSKNDWTFVHVQLEKIPASYILKRYTKKAKSDVLFDRRDRETTCPDGVKESHRSNMIMIEAFGVVRAACKSKVAYDRAMSVLKGLRNQVEEIPYDKYETLEEHHQPNGEHFISKDPSPNHIQKVEHGGPDEEITLGARGKKLHTRECAWCHLRDGHYANTCPKNTANFAKISKVSSRGKGKRGRPVGGSGSGQGHHTAMTAAECSDLTIKTRSRRADLSALGRCLDDE